MYTVPQHQWGKPNTQEGFFRIRHPNLLLLASTTYHAEGVDRTEEVRVVLLEGHGHQVTGLVLAQVLRGGRHHTTPHHITPYPVVS